MKLLIPLAAVAIPMVLSQDEKAGKGNWKANRTAKKQREALEDYVQLILDDSDGEPMAAHFAAALRAKANAEGIPFHVMKMIKNMGNASARELNCRDEDCKVPLTLRGIWNYGCWCNFGSQLTTGAGAPVSHFDGLCQSMQSCLRCARRDGIEDGYECDPKSHEYHSSFTFTPSIESLAGDCEDANPDDPCGTHMCTCELQLIADLLESIWSGVTYSNEFLHENGFDMEANCPSGSQNGDQTCCGSYPWRAPFSGSTKDCCTSVEEIFNPLAQQCCDEGVKDLGELCA